MKIRIQSKVRDGSYTKVVTKEVNAFFYDEDCFHFDYDHKRFSLPFLEIEKLRKKTLKELEKENGL